VTELTVETVARDVERFAVGEVIAAGGGIHNPTLMAGLRRRLSGVRLATTAEFGIPPTAKEAIAFALIGFLTVSGIPANVPTATGAGHPVLLGRVTPARGPTAAMPRALVVEERS
jgi:anhydro-N-acetylmuramic acid kinase